MPRVSRKLIGSSYVHNMVQGINKEYIFQSEKEKYKYLYLMNKYSKKYQVLIIAYCIMDNHAHILTFSENIQNVSLFMKDTNTEYAIYYNKSKDRIGYVFRNRFNSKLIYNQEYLFKCIKYIHMNPVKAQISKKEEEYKFSSYKNYIEKCGNVNEKLLEIVFNNEKEYIKIIKSTNYENLNLEKEKVNLKEILDVFLIQKGVNLQQIQKSDILIKQFISYLISNEYEFKKQDIANILNISRAKLYRKLK